MNPYTEEQQTLLEPSNKVIIKHIDQSTSQSTETSCEKQRKTQLLEAHPLIKPSVFGKDDKINKILESIEKSLVFLDQDLVNDFKKHDLNLLKDRSTLLFTDKELYDDIWENYDSHYAKIVKEKLEQSIPSNFYSFYQFINLNMFKDMFQPKYQKLAYFPIYFDLF